jgi:transposase
MKPYSDDLRGRVVLAMEGGMTCREASERFSIAPSTAGNWHRLWRSRKSFKPLPIGGDRRSKLLDELGWLTERLALVPDLTLAEVRNDLADRGVEVSYAGVQRTVKRLGLRFKKNDICD